MLAKRAEAGILKASNLPDTEIIDKATNRGRQPIGPNRQMNLFVGLLIGLIIPVTVLLLRETLNQKVRSQREIELLTTIPFAGIVPHSDYKTNLVVLQHPKSSISEAFRSLRSTLSAQPGVGGRAKVGPSR